MGGGGGGARGEQNPHGQPHIITKIQIPVYWLVHFETSMFILLFYMIDLQYMMIWYIGHYQTEQTQINSQKEITSQIGRAA